MGRDRGRGHDQGPGRRGVGDLRQCAGASVRAARHFQMTQPANDAWSRSERPPWMEKPTLLGTLLRGVILVLVVLIVTVPFVSVLATSLASDEDILQSGGLVLF